MRGNMGKKNSKKILIVEDDVYWSTRIMEELNTVGIKALVVRTIGEAQVKIKTQRFDTVILDIRFPVGENAILTADELSATQGGYRSGKVLANWIIMNYTKIRLIAYTSINDNEIRDFFQHYCDGFVSRTVKEHDFVIDYICKKRNKPKSFIVHGHDEILLLKLEKFIQNSLHFPKPIVLRNQPNLGRTIIEKFEEEASDTDLVFVLLTPDDVGYKAGTDDEKRRSRQNVIFEMGYFLGKLGRRENNKRIILLYKGENELPSDISGIVHIDISNGIKAAAKSIRREVDHFLKKP